MYDTKTDIQLQLTFDDVQIVPKYSEIASREFIDTRTAFTRNYELVTPFVAAPMDTVCEVDVAFALWMWGGAGVIHRFCTIEQQKGMIASLCDKIANAEQPENWVSPIAAAIGANGDSIERAKQLLRYGANIIVIDVAHGHHLNVKECLRELQSLKSDYEFDIVAGSIATEEAANDLAEWGADALRVGVGGGSVCETRVRTGIGVPQLQAVINIAKSANIPIISDGGIRYPGDAAKAMAAGADSVMIGSLFAGTDESPGEVFIAGQWPNDKPMKIYRGLASATTKLKYVGAASHVEGASKIIEGRGSINRIVNGLLDGLRSSMSYVGASNVKEFRTNSEFIRITPAGLAEAHPHLLK